MLLVSRYLQAGDGEFGTAARAWLDRVAGSYVDPIVATKFWHIDCVFVGQAPSPTGRLLTGLSCGGTPRKYHGKFAFRDRRREFFTVRDRLSE